MTDEWQFRTTTGRATVADGRLRVSSSLRRMAREKWREGWTRNDAGRRILFVVSLVGSLAFLSRAVPSARDVLTGSAETDSWFVLGAVGLVGLLLTYRLARTRSVRLRDVEAVKRVDHDRLRVEYAEGRKHFDVETPTEADADDAVEILRLRGVPVEEATDSDVPTTRGFRERLRAKAE